MALIVVIEDNQHSARMVDKLLSHAGHDVMLADDGEMGLMTVFENQPDLILIDLGLPDMDGQTVIGLARQRAELAKTPIVAFTAWPPGQAQEMADKYGCDGVITKPIETRQFVGQVEAYLPQTNQPDETKSVIS